MLQKPFQKSKSREYLKALEQRMDLRTSGKIMREKESKGTEDHETHHQQLPKFPRNLLEKCTREMPPLQ